MYPIIDILFALDYYQRVWVYSANVLGTVPCCETSNYDMYPITDILFVLDYYQRVWFYSSNVLGTVPVHCFI